MPSLPPLASRLLALALLGVLVAVAWVGAVNPVIAKRQHAQLEIEHTRDLLQRYRAINAGRDALEAERAYWRDEVLPRSGMLAATTASAAAAELQSKVSNIVKEQGGDLLSIQILPGGAEGGLQAVSVRVQFSADVEALTNIFYNLESTTPYLFLDNLQIRTGHGGARSRAARLRGEIAPSDDLFVTTDVYGYMRGGPS